MLILDNVENPQEILSAFIPSKHQESILITTRWRDVGTLAYSEMLPLLSEDDAVLFLLRRAGRIPKKASVTDVTSGDFVLARDLCQLLGRLPLALDQAGAYIAENGGSLQNYIDLYHKYRPILLDRRNAVDQPGRDNGSDHPDSVLLTFWLSWDQIQQHNVLAEKVLQFCSFLSPDNIPEPLVQRGVCLSENEGEVNKLEMDEAVGLLHRYSLVERTEHMLSLHRLVQEVMQEVLSEEARQQWMRRAIKMINVFFPSGEHGTWLQCESLLPHALICAKWVSVLDQKKSEDARLLGASGRYLYERGQYREAEPLLKHALLIREEQLEVSYTDMTNSLNNLAGLYRAQGRYGEAEPLLRHALRIAEKQLGASHPQTATTLNNLAAIYESQGHYGEAEPLYQRALRIQEEQLGTSHPDTLSSLNNLALLYYHQGRYREAESLLKRALHIAEEQLGASHLMTQQILKNLLTLLSHLYTNGDMEALFQLLAQSEQDGNTYREASQE